MREASYKRIMVISDLHGSEAAFTTARERYEQEEADHLLIAGDITARYSEQLAGALNSFRNHITAVGGNCDSSWEEQVLFFPLPEFQQFSFAGRHVFLTHGNRITPAHPPLLPPGAIFISGHTHRPEASWLAERDLYLLNPGSIAQPRGGQRATYGIITADAIEVRELHRARQLMHMHLKL